MRHSLWLVLAQLQGQGLYVRWHDALLRPADWLLWYGEGDDRKPATYKPLAKPGKPQDYCTKVGDVRVSGGRVLHIYSSVGKGEKETDFDKSPWAYD